MTIIALTCLLVVAAAAAGLCGYPLGRDRRAEDRESRNPTAGSATAKTEGRQQAPRAKILCAAERRADRRYQGPPETLLVPGVLLAGGGEGAARGCAKNPRLAAGRPERR